MPVQTAQRTRLRRASATGTAAPRTTPIVLTWYAAAKANRKTTRVAPVGSRSRRDPAHSAKTSRSRKSGSERGTNDKRQTSGMSQRRAAEATELLHVKSSDRR